MPPADTPTDVVRASLSSYLYGDRDAAEPLYADDFVFTSPQDDHIDRATFFEKCFPTADRFSDFVLVHVLEAGADQAVVVYEYEVVGGERYRNAELHTVRDGRITEVQVFFGGAVGGATTDG